MTDNRLYYDDAYTNRFTATVVERTMVDGCPAVVLDQTYFYPTSGGQPHDTGRLDACLVVDVLTRDADDAILHVLDTWPDEVTISAEIDWPRRFDHMQQHTGQHILSRAFVQLADANTIGFHLSPDSVTIDLDIPHLSSEQLDAVETLSNQIVWDNRPITASFMSKSDALQLALRKVPDVDGDTLRIVEIAGFDWNACGGTHVAHTGEVGLIKIVKLDRQRGNLRVEFCCGQRALLDYRAKNGVVNQISAELTCGYWEIGSNLTKMRTELQAARKTIKQQQATLLQYEADQLHATGEEMESATVIARVFTERDSAEIRNLANQISRKPGTIVLFAVYAPATALIFARAKDVDGDMADLLQRVLHQLGDGKGGGSSTFAQGSTNALYNGKQPPAALFAALAAAKEQLRQ
ncbi:MAG: DHHA1 domain-containing protein [Anaerolineae bacterium]|nr:DHHA1 domain-containing protein [Anaerolineae bacterium]